MTAEATQIDPAGDTGAVRASGTIHPAWLRITHWINAVAVVVMIGSGWEIYNASPLFRSATRNDHHRRLARRGAALAFRRDVAARGQWARLRHARVLTGRFRRKLLPIRPGEVVADARAALRGRLSHDDLSVYNAVQKLLYLGVILAGVVVVLSGLAIWKPVQLQELTALLGGYDLRAMSTSPPWRRSLVSCSFM